jgi:hypothetical protein
MKQQKGGSVASDAVTSLVSADTYKGMNNMFSNQYSNNKQCGGKKSNKCPTCGGSYKKKREARARRGGGIVDSLQQGVKSATNAMKLNFVNESPFQSTPAPALSEVLPRNAGVKDQFVNPIEKTIDDLQKVVNVTKKSSFVNAAANSPKVPNVSKPPSAPAPKAPATVSTFSNGGNDSYANYVNQPHVGGKKKCKHPRKHHGGSMKSMSEMMSQNANSSYALFNKKGGSKDGFGLNYDLIKSVGQPNGDTVDRSVASSEVPNRILANESYSGMPRISKFTAYGSPSDTKLPFAYSSQKVSVAAANAAAASTGGASKEKLKALFKKARSLAKSKAKKAKSVKKSSNKKA